MAAALGALPPQGQNAGQEAGQETDREGDGVYAKTRCIRPSAHMPIVAFVPPSTYAQTCRTPAALDTARAYRGVTERPPKSNNGPVIRQFLESVGLGGGYAWCAAYTSYALQRSGAKGPAREGGPVIRSAGTRDYLQAEKLIEPRSVIRGRAKVPEGALVVWSVRGSWRGHIGLVRAPWTGRCGRTLEGNTSPPSGP
jgi:hypothetical protein